MKLKPLFLLSLVLGAVSCGRGKSTGASQATPAPATSAPKQVPDAEPLRADLRHLATELPRLHKNLFFRLPEARWKSLASALDAELANLDRAQAAVRFAQLVAAVGDGHTELGLASLPEFGRLPLMLHRFSDGLYIADVAAEHSAFRGKRIVRIGKLDAEAALAAVAPLISFDNAGSLAARSAQVLTIPEVLGALGITDPGSPVRITTADGGVLELARVKSLREVRWAEPAQPVPLHRRRPQLAYWNDYLPEHKTLYLKYNRCADDPAAGMTFARLVEGTLAFMKTKPVERFVLDLRDNGGGDSGIAAPLIEALAAHPDLNRRGRLFVLIGRHTFSSAVLNTLELQKKTQALLVGEPTGGRPNHYGEVKTFTLPHSGWTVSYSTKYFTTPLVKGDPDAIVPDLPVDVTGVAWFSGRDPVLEAVLKFKP